MPSLDPDRNRDLRGREREVWARRAIVALFLAVAVFALLNGVGQRASTVTASRPAAELSLHSPTRVRGGLIYQARVTVRAHSAVEQPKLVLSSGWFDGLTINTTEPAASEEANRNGDIALSYNRLPAGQVLNVYIQYQVNPTTVGKKTQRLELDDGGRTVATLERSLTVLP